MRNILLSPIGKSPGAVTGIYYALAEQDFPVQIDQVVLLATAMPRVQDACELVRDVIGADKVRILPLRTATQPSHDFNDAATVLDFIQQANAVLAHGRKAGNQIYIGISGGRSSMGALATLSAYVYGAAGIFHLWVDESIEAHGSMEILDGMLEPEYMAILKPPREKYRLVSIPLTPFDQLWDRGRLGELLAERPEARQALLRAVTDIEMQQLEQLKQRREISFQEAAGRLREIFAGTELQDAVEASIKIAGSDEKGLPWEVALKPYIKPAFWKQVRRDVNDWENWKAGADRLFKLVEAVATPLTIAYLALALGIPPWK